MFGFSNQTLGESSTDKRMKALEEQLIELKVESERKIKALEDKLIKSQKRNKKRNSRLNRKLDAITGAITNNGFLSAGVSKSSIDWIGEEADIDFKDEFTYNTDSVIGLQSEYRLSDKLSATVQMVARGFSNYDLQTEWLYFRYHFSDQLSVRVGRRRGSVFMYSEELEVGFAYPWVRPPMGYYITSSSSGEGFNIDYKWQVGETFHRIIVGVSGTSNAKITAFLFDLDDVYTFTYTIDIADYTIRVAELRTDASTTLSDLNLTLSDRIKFHTFGLIYDNGSWLISTEYFRSEGSEVLTMDVEAFYVSLSRRFRKFQPYITFSSQYSTGVDVVPFYLDNLQRRSKRKISSIGFRYDLTSKLAIKMQAEHLYDRFEGKTPDGIDFYSIVFDMVF